MKSPSGSDSNHVRHEIPEYVEGRLRIPDAARVRSHLASCTECRADYEWTARYRTEVLSAHLRHLPAARRIELANGDHAPTADEDAHIALCSSCQEDIAWARTHPLPPEPTPELHQNILVQVFVTPLRRNSAAALAVAAGIVLLCLLLGVPVLRERLASPSIAGNTVAVSAGVLGRLWSQHYAATISRSVEPNWPGPRTLVYGLSGDGPDGGQLFARELASGRLLWSAKPDLAEIAEAFGKDYADSGAYGCSGLHFADLDGDGVDEILAEHMHNTWFPAYLSVHRFDGATLGTYYHWGHINDVHVMDRDSDGRDEIVLAGTNNALPYQGATLLILDATHLHGASVDSLVRPDSPLRDSSLVRVVFPRYEPEFMALLGTRRLEARSIAVTHVDGKPVFRVAIGDGGNSVMVYLDAELRPIDVSLSDGLIVTANRWPERLRDRFLSPEYQREWLSRCYRYGALAAGRP